ncbi:hypothetical protein VTJ49DRAFT_3808 [Mycothermus thermophilus]|uniref:Nucleoporin protein Ndc1-Nup n=1 Tax=Humicola insolens TaxID=85995 RepID=A0ABR3V7I9_HUMIN
MAAATVRRSPYKDFLQPALQRRFATASLVVLAIAYVQALFFASWRSYFWSWFPIGPTGFRAITLFFGGILIVILRISQYHPGLRTSDSGFQTFLNYTLKWNTLETLFAYTASATLFGFVYLWSLDEDAGLEFVTYYTGDRARLNEKPLYLLSHLALLGVYETITHLVRDTDRLALGAARPQNGGAAGKEDGDPSVQLRRFRDRLPSVLAYAINHSLLGILFNTFVYPMFVRPCVWRTSLAFLRPIYNLPRSSNLPSSMPFFSASIVFRAFISGLMITFAWAAANTAFSLFLAKQPIKNGKPLTSDSRDPNGSLLNGLKNKKLSIKCFAIWELALIARDFPDRRKAIYEDIDRKDGPMWSQVYKICTDILKTLETNMDAYTAAPPQPEPAPTVEPATEEKQRTIDPPRDDDIFQPVPQSKGLRGQAEKAATQTVLAPGQGSPLRPAAKRAVETAKQRLVDLQKEATGTGDQPGLLRDKALSLLQSPIGWPFRQHYRRRVARGVLGGPYGEPNLYANAAYALGGLAAHSLREDKYGHVQRDVATLVRTLTGLARRLDAFRAELPVHWTDVEAERDCPEVDEVRSALRDALRSLVEAFGPYARDLRLSLADMRLAREAAGLVETEKEMVEVKGRGRRSLVWFGRINMAHLRTELYCTV